MSYLLHIGDFLLGGKESVDDSVDKIHRRVTIVFLLALSLPLFTKQFAGEPIECFTPSYFTEAQSRYVNSYCWTVSTFYLDHQPQQSTDSSRSPGTTKKTNYQQQHSTKAQQRLEDVDNRSHSIDYVDEYELPTASHPMNNKVPVKVSYYQWAPIILLAKAVTFYIPFALWKALARNRGISVQRLMGRVTRLGQIGASHPDRSSLIHEIVEQLHTLRSSNDRSASLDSSCQTSALLRALKHNRLFFKFIAVKCLYLCNVILQFYLLVSFLGEDYLTHGLDIIRHLWTKREWWTSPRFPLQTLCSVRAAQQGSMRLYQCHCVLPINLFNEKICSIWWFYVASLFPLTCTSLATWLYRCSSRSRLNFMSRYLLEGGEPPQVEEMSVNHRSFVIDYLGCDGNFLLRLIEINHGSAILHPIVQSLLIRSKTRPLILFAEHPFTSSSSISVPMQPASPSPVIDDPLRMMPEVAGTPPSPTDIRRQQHETLVRPKFKRYLGGIRRSVGVKTSPTSIQHSPGGTPFHRMRARRSLQIHPTGIS